MTLAYDLTVGGVIIAISVIIWLISVELFAPGTALHQTASQATNLQGAERADLWYTILARWVPLGGIFTGIAWPFVRAYRRQAVTAQRAVR